MRIPIPPELFGGHLDRISALVLDTQQILQLAQMARQRLKETGQDDELAAFDAWLCESI